LSASKKTAKPEESVEEEPSLLEVENALTAIDLKLNKAQFLG
jgi:hypothetical protein